MLASFILIFYFDFKMESIGKGYGLHRWIACGLQFAVNTAMTDIDFDLSSGGYLWAYVVPVGLSILLLIIAATGKKGFVGSRKVSANAFET